MKKVSVLMTFLMAFAVIFTAFADTADAGKRSRRNAVVGVGVGIAALAIIAAASQSKKAYADERGHRHRGYSYRGGGRNYCANLLRKCNNGRDWACEKYETGGCTE